MDSSGRLSPYRTNLWQVSDAESRNGQFKIFTYKQKVSVLARKRFIYNFNSSINISKHDKIPIVDYTWKKIFAEEESDKTDIAICSWNPINYNFLNHAELKNNEFLSGSSDNNGNNQTNNKELTRMDLNFRSIYDACIVFEFLRLEKRDSKIIRRVDENKENQINTFAIFDNIK